MQTGSMMLHGLVLLPRYGSHTPSPLSREHDVTGVVDPRTIVFHAPEHDFCSETAPSRLALFKGIGVVAMGLGPSYGSVCGKTGHL